jgi:hypothetical protein
MKTSISPSLKASLKRIAVSQLFLFLLIVSSFGQETPKPEKVTNQESDWWIPILVKHKAVLKGCNHFKNIFEMGETNSIKDGVCTLTNAFIILRHNDDNYTILESPLITHDFNKELLITNEGTMKFYRKDSKITEPVTFIQIQKMELKFPKN